MSLKVERMDVTSLLNTVRPPSLYEGRNEDSSVQPGNHETLSSPNILPIPWAEDANRSSYRLNGQNVKLWDAGGVTGPRIDGSDSQTRAGLLVSPKYGDREVFERNDRTRQSSMDLVFGATSQLPIHLAKHNLPSDEDRTRKTRPTPQERHGSCWGKLPTTPRHKLSFSNSSFVLPDSPLSECHSRLSSVASASGFSSSTISAPEMPLVYAKRFEPQSPQLDLDITAQPPSLPLTEQGSAAKRSRVSLVEHALSRYADAVLNLRSPEQPVFLWGDLRSDLAARPRNHKRATSVPVLASRTTTPTSDTFNDRYPVSATDQFAMNQSIVQGLPTQAEEPQPAMAPVYPDMGPEHRVLRHHALKNGHANMVADRAPTCEADIQSRDHVHDQVASITPLAQLACGMVREASLNTSMAALEEEPRCMFVDNCQTGSQLRKAISHLFGRNKACTLRIPKQVWVYYCRKHYQRIRYRNAKTYPLNQMYLVKMQINRLQRWSDENQRRGAGPYIKLWTLALRKREQSRLDKETGATDEGGGDDDGLETATGSAAPDWIIQRLGTGYTTEEMLEVADQLYLEIENGTLVQVPEVEFLPDITESKAGNIAKLVKSRKQGRTIATPVEAKAYKRRISDTADAIGQKDSLLPNQYDADEIASPLRKRVRVSSLAADHYRPPLHVPLPSITSYASSRVSLPTVDQQTVMPRILPAAPRMQMPSPGRSQGPVAHMYGFSPTESRRPNALSGLYGHDQQQYAARYYRMGVESPFQGNRDPHNQQRLPSISAHLAGTSSIQDSALAIPWALVSDGTNIPRPPRLRSYSDNVPTTQPVPQYPRPISSSGAPQSGLTCFDNGNAISSTNEPEYRDYTRGQWPGPTYAPGWSQRSGPRQQSHYHDQVTRPQLDSLRAAANLGPVKLRTPYERAEHEAHRYGDTWAPAAQSTTKVAREGRED
ncbi:hypothetical protein J3F83DRAFT_399641 [Trichoderma novae-zelandiae]